MTSCYFETRSCFLEPSNLAKPMLNPLKWKYDADSAGGRNGYAANANAKV
jgi:hypothetical protein